MTRSIRNCTVAVVGGAGFLGSHLTEHLIEDRGCDVRVIDNLVIGRREWVHPKAAFFHTDITDSEAYLKYLFSFGGGCRFVFNYAAHPYIPLSFTRPLHVFETNATGAIKVINAAQEAGCEGVLQVSSAELYGDTGRRKARPDPTKTLQTTDEFNDHRIRETDEVLPHSTYGAAKAAVDYYCQAAWRERQTPVIALRQFNCLGERESHPYVVPEIVSQLDKYRDATGWCGQHKSVEVRLGNNSFRDFLYAGDAVKLAVELLERGSFGEVYNLGSETGVKVYDLAKLIGRVMGFNDVTVVEDERRKRPWEIWSLLSCNDKLHALGVSKPTVDLEDALKRTIAWFQQNGCVWPWECGSLKARQ